MASGVDAGIDYYAVLGVEPDASNEEILAAWRRLAKRWHPDLHPEDPRADERMRIINRAKDVLCDQGRRRTYDRDRASAHQDDGVEPGDRPPTAIPSEVDFGVVDAGTSSPVVEVSVRVSPPPRSVALERDRGDFWSLTDDAYYVPCEDELTHPDEFLRIRIQASAPANPHGTDYRDGLIIRLDSHALRIPLSLKVRRRARATASPTHRTVAGAPPPRTHSPSGYGGATGATPSSSPGSPASDLALGLILVLMHCVPVVALVAQAGLQNPGSAAAIPMWLVGFAGGLTLWAIARSLAGDRRGRLSTYLATPIAYLGVGFALWLILGFALYS